MSLGNLGAQAGICLRVLRMLMDVLLGDPRKNAQQVTVSVGRKRRVERVRINAAQVKPNALMVCCSPVHRIPMVANCGVLLKSAHLETGFARLQKPVERVKINAVLGRRGVTMEKLKRVRLIAMAA